MADDRTLARLRRHRDGTVDVQVQLPEGGTLTVSFADHRVRGVHLAGEKPLTPTALQRFAWARWIAVADAAVRAAAFHTRRLSPSEESARHDFVGVMGAARSGRTAKRAKPGRPWGTTRPATFYRAVAERYLTLVAAGVVNPVATIAREDGENRNTVAGWVGRARKLGFLGPATPGRAG